MYWVKRQGNRRPVDRSLDALHNQLRFVHCYMVSWLNCSCRSQLLSFYDFVNSIPIVVHMVGVTDALPDDTAYAFEAPKIKQLRNTPAD